MEVKGLEKELPETNKENYILRVCRSNYHTKEEIGNELFFMQSIAKDSKIIVPKPIKGKKDEYIQEVEWNEGKWGLSVVEMVEAIVKDKKRILPAIAYLEGEYGIHHLYLGVPTILGGKGIESVIELPLTEDESRAEDS